jgi:competence protein ComGC
MKYLLYIFLVIVLISLGLVVPEICSVRKEVRERKRINLTLCQSQLRAIYQDLKAYADQHGGRFPTKLSDLVRAGYETQDIFVCPNSNDDYIPPGTPATRMAAEMDGLNRLNRGSYEYYGANLTESSPPESVLIAELAENHAPLGGHVLYLNGNVVLLTPKDLETARRLLRDRKTSISTTEP